MRNFLQKYCAVILLPLIIVCFLSGFQELWDMYTSFWLFDNAVAALFVVGLYIVSVWKYGLQKERKQSFPGLFISLGIACCCLAQLLNNYLGGFQILPPVLSIIALYLWLGFWLKPSFWKRSIFVCLLLILTLPILERLQKFIGFPLRLFTANVVSVLLQLTGAGHISQSTVITTENYATTIDLPCSGVKSIYFGGIILLAIFFLQQIRLSLKSISLGLAFFSLLVFFNIWRVFGLVYVYGVLHLIEIGDSIHVFLGIVGFVVSCLFLWFGSEYLRKKEVGEYVSEKEYKNLDFLNKYRAWFNHARTTIISLLILIFTILLTHTVLKLPVKEIQQIEQSYVISIPNVTVTEISFSDKEKTLFLDASVSFASKYILKQNNKEMSLLLVKSSSARSHHDPELCLQGLGYQLTDQKKVLVSGGEIQQMSIQTTSNGIAQKGKVYYWFVSKDKVITDYSQRVWEQFQNTDREWVLVELIVPEADALSQSELETLFNNLNDSVRAEILVQ